MAPALALLLLLSGIAAVFWPMLLALHNTWMDKYAAHSHGYLVLALAVWFAVRAWRAAPRAQVTTPVWSAAPALVVLLGLAALSEILYLGPIRTAVLPLLLLASIALCMGRIVARRMVWPVLFLYFAIPVWGVLNAPLQDLTTRIAQSLVNAVGVPVYVEGNFVHLAAGTFEIASGCSGLNYFIAALTLAAVYCTLFLGNWRSWATLMLVAAAAGLVANWLRVASLIVIGHVTKMQHYLIRVDHLYYGWVLFLLTMVPVLLVARRLEERERPLPAIAAKPAMPVRMWDWLGRAAWIFVTVMVVAVLLLALRERGGAAAARQPFVPPALQGAMPVAVFASGWQPVFAGASESRQVWTGDGTVEIYSATYARQSRAARVSMPGNSVFDHAWQVTASRVIPAPAIGPGAQLLETQGVLGGRQRLLWAWYDVAGRIAYSKPTLRTAELLGLVSGRGDARVTALLTECQGDCDQAQRRLRALLAR